MRRGGCESGQATVEWVGLVLGVALLLGAVAAGGREAADRDTAHELGEAVAQRIMRPAARAAGPAAEPTGPRLPASPPATPRTPAPLSAGPRWPSAPPAGQQARASGVAASVLKRAWLLCLGYRRLQYEREHPRTPRQGVPVKDTVKWVNECVNPLSFLFG